MSKWSTKTEEKTRKETETWVFLTLTDAYRRRDYKEQHAVQEATSFMVSFSTDLNHRVGGTVPICTSWRRTWEAQPSEGHCVPPRVGSPSAPTESLALASPREWREKKNPTTQKAAGWSHRVSSEKIQNSFVMWTRSFLACFRMI